MVFRRLPQTRINEIARLAKAQERRAYDEEAAELVDQEMAREVIAGWGEDVLGVGGKPEPFTAVALDRLLEYPTVAGQLVKAFYESINPAKRKN